jgi:hypothetical protein
MYFILKLLQMSDRWNLDAIDSVNHVWGCLPSSIYYLMFQFSSAQEIPGRDIPIIEYSENLFLITLFWSTISTTEVYPETDVFLLKSPPYSRMFTSNVKGYLPLRWKHRMMYGDCGQTVSQLTHMTTGQEGRSDPKKRSGNCHDSLLRLPRPSRTYLSREGFNCWIRLRWF